MYGAQDMWGVLDAIQEYILNRVLATQEAQNNDFESLADAITTVEYYLRSFGNGEENVLAYVEIGKANASKLRLSMQEGVCESLPSEKIDYQAKQLSEVKKSTRQSNEIIDSSSDSTRYGDTTKEHVVNQHPSDQHARNANANSTAPTESKATRVTTDHQNFAILTGEVDQDILEIFLEEADEEWNNVKDLFPEWQRHTDDFEALLSIRRSFHTLKGSGRLVGAKLLGEFAWAYENLLNRVLDHKLPASHDIIDELSKAIDTLPSLIAQLRGRETQDMDPYSLMDKAHMLSKGSFTDEQQARNN
jgi:chemosensory pili system protein ChpA (sensor histidine kinase/response regulator)